ncbi:hypothetical protein DL240_00300 [Lujinxingia litoralis]|uniref:GST N-terminal domain-containing protein n=1 Tax=Lujinxingia litoralis TaxID=2211119 RepID=A0A328C8D4_9DELT|nr:glutathione S-transferase N-terminal domain-containing protein [Lujinxingia litoralis]RAL24685.1 hypothetical protein DL240_00300 [Lujinxingia litoralis]
MGTFNTLHLFAVSLIRAARGRKVREHNQAQPPRPEQALELYEFEGCPYCRKVREALSELDISYIARTCARGDTTKRARATELSGKLQFPVLIDPNTGDVLLESSAILDHVHRHYGQGLPSVDRLTSLPSTLTGFIATLVRPRGIRVLPGLEARTQPPELPVLYGFEASPFCRKVRETLHELNLDYRMENVAIGSARRSDFEALAGRVMVPYLVDPNQDVAMFESDDIVAYLLQTYGPTGALTASPAAGVLPR